MAETPNEEPVDKENLAPEGHASEEIVAPNEEPVEKENVASDGHISE